jgi:translocation and assembly module TamB
VAEGRLDLAVAGALAEFRSRAGQTVAVRPDPLALHLAVDGGGAELDIEARQPGLIELEGRVRLAGALDPARLQQAPLNGRLRLALPTLALLEPWTGQVQGLKGSFGAGLDIEGTAEQPTLRLAASLPDGRFEVPPLGIAVRAFSLEARTGEDRTLRFSGRAASGPGELRLEGTATLDGSLGWPVAATLRGNRFLLADTPEARVFVSPDLGIAQAGGVLKLAGRVTVPEAALKAREQPGAIKPSPDVVIVGAEPPEARPGLRVETRVEVVLGDRVRVEGYGFQGRLDGKVTVEQQPRGAVFGTGEITVREGRYAYYGVELGIHDGRLLFAHSPVDNPNLAIDVNRRTDDGPTVGLKVLGTLKQPQASLYADRSLAQGDILAYLLTGRSLGMASSQEGGVLREAASALGGPAGSFLAKQIGDRLGLGSFVDISVRGSLADSSFSQGFRSPSAGGSGAQTTALFLGKYLTPKLYVQYGMGLFQNLYVLRLRYSLTENWKIQTEAGQFSGGDILYQWER